MPNSRSLLRGRRSSVALVVLLLLGGLLALTLPAQAVTSSGPSKAQATYQRTARAHTNQARTQRDLRALTADKCLQRMAVRQATRMAKRDELFHQDLGAVLRTCRLSTAGENVAAGYSSGRAVVAAWMGSSGHRANILNGSFRLVGVGAVKAHGRWYAAQVFGTR